MKPFSTLELLLRDWPGSIAQPKIARAVFFSHLYFPDAFVASIVRELMFCCGDWRRAVKEVQGVDKSRLAKFAKWAEKITARPVRGLLEWKGGAS